MLLPVRCAAKKNEHRLCPACRIMLHKMMRGTHAKLPCFPQAGLQFLRNLKRNNRREWFQERKSTYEECVRAPMEAIVDAIAPELERIAPDMMASRKVSLYRIYRDTRFSK